MTSTAREWRGSDLTVVTYGAVVQRTLLAAKTMEDQHGVSVEVIDLRSLSPVDWETIYASVRIFAPRAGWAGGPPCPAPPAGRWCW